MLGVVLWIPPVIDQFAHSPGNLGTIRDYFSHPPDSPIGFARGARRVARPARPVEAPRAHARARRRALDGQRHALPGAAAPARVARLGRRRVAHAGRALLLLDARARRRARARCRLVGADLRHRVVLPAAVGVGARPRSCCSRSGGRSSRSCVGARRGRPRRDSRRAAPRCWSALIVDRDRRVRRRPRHDRRADAAASTSRSARSSGRPSPRSTQLEAGGPARPVPRHVAARAAGHRLGGLRPAERARRRGFDVGGGRVPPRRDPLPRDRRPRTRSRSAPRDRPRHRELARRSALPRGRVLRPARRPRNAKSSNSCTRRPSRA